MTDNTIESQIARLDQALAESEKQAAAALARLKGLRKRVAQGDLTPVGGQFDQLAQQVDQLSASLAPARDSLTYDAATALADGSYLAELQAEAKAQGVVMTERDGRLTAFPLLLRLEAKLAAVRVGRKLEKRLRPSVLVRELRKAQVGARFDARRFLNQLFGAYTHLAPVAQPGWRPTTLGDGPVVTLNEVYNLFTLGPAGGEYPREALAVNLLQLDRAPDARTTQGHRFALPASTGSKGRDRIGVYDEHGSEHVYFGIRFSRDADR